MPNRTVLNKYGLFVSQIHKVLKKKALDGSDIQVVEKAKLVAMLSSRSWRTFKYLHNGDDFNKDVIKVEIDTAYKDGWKEINENDIKEVLTLPVGEHSFSMLLTCFSERPERKTLKELFSELESEFVDGIEPIESREM